MDKEMLEILKRLETKVNCIETKLDEHTQILRASEHSA